MSTLSVRLHYRPLRIGWCVAAADMAKLREASRWSFTMWGGRYNPIIPMDNPGLADSLIKLFRIDALVPVSDVPEVKAFINGYAHLSSPLLHRDLFADLGNGQRSATIADLIHPITKIYKDRHKHNKNAEPSVDLHTWDNADPLADMFLFLFGALPSAEDCGTDYAELIRLHLGGARKDIANGGNVPLFTKNRLTLSSLGCAFMEQHYIVRNHWKHAGFYVGDCDRFDDLVNFWNFRAANVPLLFYDPRHRLRLDALKQDWIDLVPSIPRGRYEPSGVAVWLPRYGNW